MKNEITKKLRDYLPEIKTKYKVKQIGIFGSQIKGRAKKISDIDIVVEFQKGGKTFDNYMELKFFLEEIFNCKVDLVIKEAIKEELKPYILAEVVYA